MPSAFTIPGTIVFAATDPVGGNDATGVFATATPGAATASPFKTVTGLLAAMPRFGNMCTFVCLMKPGNYYQPFTLTLDNLDVVGFSDYQSMLFRGSDFTNSAMDKAWLAETNVPSTQNLGVGYAVQTNVITPNLVDYSTGSSRIHVRTASPHGLTTGDLVAGRGFAGAARVYPMPPPTASGL